MGATADGSGANGDNDHEDEVSGDDAGTTVALTKAMKTATATIAMTTLAGTTVATTKAMKTATATATMRHRRGRRWRRRKR